MNQQHMDQIIKAIIWIGGSFIAGTIYGNVVPHDQPYFLPGHLFLCVIIFYITTLITSYYNDNE